MSKIILLTHQKGGVGKSTLAYNLAQNFKEHSKVVILDFDNQGSLLQISGLVDFDILPYYGDIEKIKELEYDYIFIDTPPYLMNKLEELCNIADVIVVPTKVGILDLFAIEKTISMIKQSGNIDKTLVVFNMVKPNTTLTEDIKEKLRELDVFQSQTLISDSVSFIRSVVSETPLSDNPKAKQQIDDLTMEVLGMLIKEDI